MDISIPGYRLLRTLGKGGMATVFLAQQQLLERKVALKVLKKGLADDQDFGERFMREAKIVSQLVHPNIVTVHEVGQHNGHYFLSMEYIDGYDLRLQAKKISLIEKVRAVEDIARALHYAGEKGYVHRDIKPENIMFRSGDGSAVLTDFGIARAIKTDLSMTQTGIAIGTPYYMSPEQAKGLTVDHRSDLYSLGVVFYMLMTGHVPYDADTPIAIGIKHITEPVPQLPSALSDLQFVLNGLMAKKPEDRYQNGLTLLNDLRQVDLEHICANVDDLEFDATMIDIAPQVDEAQGEPYDPNRFTLQFDASEKPIPQPASVWPVILASVFILFALFVVVYVSRPLVMEPVIVYIDNVISRTNFLAGEKAGKVKTFVNRLLAPENSTDAGKVGNDSRPTEKLSPSKFDEKERESNQNSNRNTATYSARPNSKNNGSEGGAYSITPEDKLNVSSATKPIPSQNMLLEQILILGKKYFRDDGLITINNVHKRLSPVWRHKNPDKYLNYVAAHQSLLQIYPRNVRVASSLRHIKNNHKESVLELARSRDSEAVRRATSEYLQTFPESQAGEINEIKKETKKLQQIARLFKQAEEREKSSRVVSPKGKSAVSSYLSILKLDPRNDDAKLRLNAVAKPIINKVEKDLQKAKTPEEWRLAKTMLSYVDFDHNQRSKLVDLKRHIDNKLRAAESVQNALVRAKKYVKIGNLYMPLEHNAYDEYKNVLKLDPTNNEAKKGMESLITNLSVKVWDLVGDEKFDEAKTTLQRPLALLPGNQRLNEISEVVNEVIAN